MSAKLGHFKIIMLVNPSRLTATPAVRRSRTYIHTHHTNIACVYDTSVWVESCRQHHTNEMVCEGHVTNLNLQNAHGPFCTPRLDRHSTGSEHIIYDVTMLFPYVDTRRSRSYCTFLWLTIIAVCCSPVFDSIFACVNLDLNRGRTIHRETWRTNGMRINGRHVRTFYRNSPVICDFWPYF